MILAIFCFLQIVTGPLPARTTDHSPLGKKPGNQPPKKPPALGMREKVVGVNVQQLATGAQVATKVIEKQQATFEAQKKDGSAQIPKATLDNYKNQGLKESITKFPMTWKEEKDPIKKQIILKNRDDFVKDYVQKRLDSWTKNQYVNPNSRLQLHGTRTKRVVEQTVTEPANDHANQIKTATMLLDIVERVLAIIREHVLARMALLHATLQVRDLKEKVKQAIAEDQRIFRSLQTNFAKLIRSVHQRN